MVTSLNNPTKILTRLAAHEHDRFTLHSAIDSRSHAEKYGHAEKAKDGSYFCLKSTVSAAELYGHGDATPYDLDNPVRNPEHCLKNSHLSISLGCDPNERSGGDCICSDTRSEIFHEKGRC